MKKLLLSILTLTSVFAFAQKDFSTTLITPANGYAIVNGSSFDITGTINNVGSVPITTNDSFMVIFIVGGVQLKNTSGAAIGQSFVNTPIPVGGSVPFKIAGLSYSGITTFRGSTFCAQVLVFATVNGTLTIVADANPANDQACNGVTFSVNAGVNDIANTAQSVKVYPNPAKDVINFSIDGSIAKTINIMDITGRTVEVVKVNANDTQINIGEFSNGIYLYQIKSENGVLIKSGKFNVSK